jgi:NhaP-type Na+/H+ or K+/H+ antiporter
MNHAALLTVAIALATGVVVQVIASHVNIPGIALLLVAGYLLGPDAAHLIDPRLLGDGLPLIVEFSVAIILFEGGMNLSLSRLRREQLVIRRLVLRGGSITAVAATLVAWLLLRWPFRASILFGTLVVVTGPTVVTPLLRRIHIKKHLATILEAEGVIVDALGALVAVVVLELAIDTSLSARSFALGIGAVLARLGAGVAIGLMGGGIVSLMLHFEGVVPHRLGNVTALGFAVVTAQASSALVPTSGIVAAVVAGIVVGHFQTRVGRELREFKEQLTVMLIGMLFILLAASVRRQELIDLGWPAVVAVLILMLVVRPLAVVLSTAGTELTGRERAFIAWLAPRGVIAAAIASVFAEALERSGHPGGQALRAMVFVVIATTVLVQGLSAGLVARLLRVRQPAQPGYVVVGANGLGRLIADTLRETGADVVMVDADPDVCRQAEAQGFRVVLGSALEDRTLQRAGLDARRCLIAITKNEGVNVLCVGKARTDFRSRGGYAGVDVRKIGVNAATAGALGANVLFGAPRDLKHWIGQADRGAVTVERWTLGESARRGSATHGNDWSSPDVQAWLLPIVRKEGSTVSVVDGRWAPRRKDEVWVGIAVDQLASARQWLEERGWHRSIAAAGKSRPMIHDPATPLSSPQ